MDKKKVILGLSLEARQKFKSLEKSEKRKLIRKTEFYAFREHRIKRAKYIRKNGYKDYRKKACDRDFISEYGIKILEELLMGKSVNKAVKDNIISFLNKPYLYFAVVIIAFVLIGNMIIFQKKPDNKKNTTLSVTDNNKANNNKKKTRKRRRVKRVKVYKSDVSYSTKSYRAIMEKHCSIYDISDYIEIIMAITEQESGGQGIDVMQSSESGYGQNNPVLTAEESINAGVHLFSVCIKIAKCRSPKDIERLKLALQGYNYGYGYIKWANLHYGGFSEENARIFSANMKYKMKVDRYGDPEYVYHVMRYYKMQKIKVRIKGGKKR